MEELNDDIVDKLFEVGSIPEVEDTGEEEYYITYGDLHITHTEDDEATDKTIVEKDGYEGIFPYSTEEMTKLFFNEDMHRWVYSGVDTGTIEFTASEYKLLTELDDLIAVLPDTN